MADTIHIFATAGNGPVECCLALEGILGCLEKDAALRGVLVDISPSQARMGVSSALVSVSGDKALAFAQSWFGTMQWQCQSQVRKGHRRKNWFVGFFKAPPLPGGEGAIDTSEVRFETFRAGGPGGQHQNKTDSAVRARWRGFVASSRSERSQHRNKALALERLQILVSKSGAAAAGRGAKRQHDLHHQIERGNPVRVFIGPGFCQG
ncbi:MAG: peptide chain release factor H [Planktomarina sp.]